MTEVYAWPRQVVPFPGTRATAARPAADWDVIDAALVAACAASPLRMRVLLVPSDAKDAARHIYVLFEPMLDAVIAIGHRDHSVAWCVTDVLIARNETALNAIIDEVNREIVRDSVTGALLAIVPHVSVLW